MRVVASDHAVVKRYDYGKLTLMLSLPQIISTAILAILGGVPDSTYAAPIIGILSVAAFPAFMVAAYAGPLLLILAGPVAVRAIASHQVTQAVTACSALLLGFLSFTLFDRVVMWWDLPLP